MVRASRTARKGSNLVFVLVDPVEHCTAHKQLPKANIEALTVRCVSLWRCGAVGHCCRFHTYRPVWRVAVSNCSATGLIVHCCLVRFNNVRIICGLKCRKQDGLTLSASLWGTPLDNRSFLSIPGLIKCKIGWCLHWDNVNECDSSAILHCSSKSRAASMVSQLPLTCRSILHSRCQMQ